MIDLSEFSPADWIFASLAFMSALAAWYGAIISRRNQKQLERRDKVCLRSTVRHHPTLLANGTRCVDDEWVEVLVFNEGRPLQLETIMFRPKGVEKISSSFYTGYSVGRSFNFETHTTIKLALRVCDLLELDELAGEKKPIRVFLADGKLLDYSPKGLGKVLRELAKLQKDLADGFELILPQLYVYEGSVGRPIESYAAAGIPKHAAIRCSVGKQSIPPEEEAIWRSGRNPQREQIEAARAKKQERQRGWFRSWSSVR